MKLKPIEENMVVHCKTEDEAKELIKWAYECGYKWTFASAFNTHYEDYATDTCYKMKNGNIEYGATEYYFNVIEFSDIIIPEEQEEHMSAEEVVKWLTEKTYEDYIGAFGTMADLKELSEMYSYGEIISKIESYEAKKKQEKEVEVEWVYRVFNYKENKDEFFTFEIGAIQRCEEIVKNNPENYAKYEKVCRVKTE
jgi:hypothetical protein